MADVVVTKEFWVVCDFYLSSPQGIRYYSAHGSSGVYDLKKAKKFKTQEAAVKWAEMRVKDPNVYFFLGGVQKVSIVTTLELPIQLASVSPIMAEVDELKRLSL